MDDEDEEVVLDLRDTDVERDDDRQPAILPAADAAWDGLARFLRSQR